MIRLDGTVAPLSGFDWGGECNAGIAVYDNSGGRGVIVAWMGSIHDSALQHELMHIRFGDEGDPDQNHTRPEWQPWPAQMMFGLAARGY